jgi:hypothetical protein
MGHKGNEASIFIIGVSPHVKNITDAPQASRAVDELFEAWWRITFD